MIENKKRTNLIQTGVSIAEDIASQAGLPLLEKNSTLLSDLLKKLSEKPIITYVSIIDHKNKIIAFTDQDQFLSLNRDKSHRKDNVFFWKIKDIHKNQVMHFSTDITFSNTKIGEVLISLADTEALSDKKYFFGFALATFLCICGFFAYTMRNTIHLFLVKLKKSFSDVSTNIYITDKNFSMKCPFCGAISPFSKKKFDLGSLEKDPVLILHSEKEKFLYIKDISKREDLTWLKKRIVIQCTEIINKIAS
ncbi:MAG: hypothetical protein R6U68_02260 [Desulfobacteraceae bacterium]